MKKLFVAAIAAASLCSAPALAADMVAKAQPKPVGAPAYNWTGFYIGGNVGGGWSDGRWLSTGVPGLVLPGFVDANYTASGFLGGFQGGFNYQFGWTVVGVEGDWNWSRLDGSTGCFNYIGAGPQFCGTQVNGIGTATARLGTAWDRTLIYVKGGAAWVNDDHSNPCSACSTTGGPATWTASETRSGWTIGGGVEYAFASRWSVKAEYDYADFGTRTLTFAAPGQPPFLEGVRQNIQSAKVGVNYRFSLQ